GPASPSPTAPTRQWRGTWWTAWVGWRPPAMRYGSTGTRWWSPRSGVAGSPVSMSWRWTRPMPTTRTPTRRAWGATTPETRTSEVGGTRRRPTHHLCARRDSNPHARGHQDLNLARLPITPLALGDAA